MEIAKCNVERAPCAQREQKVVVYSGCAMCAFHTCNRGLRVQVLRELNVYSGSLRHRWFTERTNGRVLFYLKNVITF